jgi:hypothetical protein
MSNWLVRRRFKPDSEGTGGIHGAYQHVRGYTVAARENVLWSKRKLEGQMKNLIHGFMAVAALAGAVSLSAQTADEIVGKYIAAIGGKDAISQVKSMYMENSVQVMGNDNPGTTMIVDGVGYKSEIEFNGQKIIQCVTDKGGWMVNPMAGSADPAPMPDDQYKSRKGDIYVGGQLYDYAAKGSKIESFGKDGDAYKIKLTTKDDVESIYVIDPKTFLVTSILTKGDMQGQPVDITTKLSDYRKTDVGYLLPYAMDIDLGGQFSLTIAVKKVEVNKTIDPAIFEMPKPAAAAVPAAK